MRVFAVLALLAAFIAAGTNAQGDEPSSGRVYVPMDDGVELAVYLEFPEGWDGETKLPVIFQYDGYEGGGGPAWHDLWLDRDNYVIAHGGLRGAGCSGGQWALFSERQARDGAALVDWLGTQSWSNGNVGMVGHSYPGYMALFVAAQRPPHLRAITVSGTGDDIYRDVAYPGGVPSRAFGPAWLAVARPSEDYGAALSTLEEGETDCAEHTLSRTPENPGEHSLVAVLAQDQDSDFWYTHSPRSVVDRITVPSQINAQSGDEQILGSTRGSSRLFNELRVEHRQLLVTNGDHNTWDEAHEPAITSAKMAWLDHFVRGVPNGAEAEPKVRVLLESHFVDDGSVEPNGEVSSNTWPLGGTRWKTLYADAAQALSETAPAAESADLIVLGTHRQITDPTIEPGAGTSAGQEIFWSDGPDSAVYRTLPATSTQTFAGPILATVHARLYGTDAEFYVSIQDEAPDGSRSLITRGWLKASHRAVESSRTAWDGDVQYGTFHPHTNPSFVSPGTLEEYQIEVVPAAFVLREGHSLRFVVTATPLQDTYGIYQPSPPIPAEIVHGPDAPTRLLLPLVDTPPLGPEPECGTQTAVFCA